MLILPKLWVTRSWRLPEWCRLPSVKSKILLCLCAFVAALVVTGTALMASGVDEPLIPEGETLDVSGDLLRAVTWDSAVYTVDWAPDGQRLATGSGDGVVHLWDVASGKETARLRGTSFRELKVRSVVFHPEGKKLAAAYDDGIVRVWDLEEGRSEPVQLRGWTAAWSFDGRLLATGLRSGAVQVWDMESGSEAFALSGAHQDRVSALAWNARDLLASGSWDGTIWIWNGRDGSLIRPLVGHEQRVNDIAWSGDGTLLASASSDDTVRVWNVETGEQVRRFDGHQDSVLAVAWSADGETLVSGSKDQTVRIWRLSRHQDFDETPLLGHEDAVHTVALSPRGHLLASGSADGTTRIWAMTTQREALRLGGHASRVEALAFDRDGATLAVAAGEVVRTWALGTDAGLSKAPGHLPLEGDKRLMALAAGAEAMVAAGYQEGTVEIWKKGQILSSTPAHGGSVLALAFRPDAKVLASGSEDRSFIVWDLESNKQHPPVKTDRDVISALVFSPDGKTLAVGSRAGRVRRWNVEDPEEPKEIGVPLDKSVPVLSLAFPSAGEIWVLLLDRTIHAWNPAAGTSRQIRRLPERPSAVALSPDGSLLASVNLGERIVRIQSRRGSAWELTHRLVGGASDRRTWIACDVRDRCWRHDDGTLLVQQDPQGSLSPFLPPSRGEPQVEIEPPPERVEVVDGEVTSFAVKVRNVGSGPIFWVGVRRTAQASGDPLVFHPPPAVTRLEPGHEADFECRISVHTSYENPQDQKAPLELEMVSASGRLGAFDPVEVSAPTASLAWDRVKLSRKRSLELNIRNAGNQRLSRTWIVAELAGAVAVSEPIPSIDAGKTATLSIDVPDEVDLDSGVDLRLVAESERPEHRWTSEPRRVGGWLWRWGRVLLAGLLVSTLLALGLQLYEKRRSKPPQEQEAQPVDLNELSNLLQTSVDREEAYRIVEAAVLRLFPGMKGALLVLADAERLLVVHEWAGSRHEDRRYERSDCYALRKEKTEIHVVDDGGLVCAHLNERSGSYLCVALKAHGKTYGVLHLMSRDPEEKKIPRASRKLAVAVAHEIAAALAHLGKIEQMYRDELTGLLDRRSWGKQLERKLEGFVAEDRRFGAMFMDVDHFGELNKKHGHDIGDQVLRDIGELLQSQSRKHVDVVCRYGGEEFLVIMPDASLEVVSHRASQLKDKVKLLSPKTTDGEDLGRISMSFGVAAFPENGVDWDEVRNAADGALRQAKQGGRDRVVVASVPEAEAGAAEREHEDSQ